MQTKWNTSHLCFSKGEMEIFITTLLHNNLFVLCFKGTSNFHLPITNFYINVNESVLLTVINAPTFILAL